ncbi:uncharacterized protein BDR25DRAFT_261296 [Lindgomyces ingoldianus]|uniref:Uncharacterized protein n=1 Tax=Lindgomyces ingoldianus TaxID=673940 RepID=A0ACB6QVT1_9PLEO|nr:uncharacterized protein BDR25DRAFT_261296 [Lindgomyces ingoldianus]KAF2470985.1 hypothetical protein BDR25DRAFT_261296 [Lindgomyces ingoldianus]
MTSTEQILQQAADDGSLDPKEWPRALEYILARLDEIVNDFPKPTTPPSDPGSSLSNTPSRPQNVLSSQESQSADKENAPPATPPRPPVPAFPSTPSASEEPLSFPSETMAFYSSIRDTLSKNFSKSPPHTIQRLAELVLQPKERYRFLPPYLKALDRVVSVSSPTTIFPLPQAVLPTATGLLNGMTSTAPSTLGSDESLGGALLTPIPWLQNRGSSSELISESTEMVDGPHGAGRIETVSVMNGLNSPPTSTPSNPQIQSSHPNGESLPSTGPVTQGEILRQEQEAGVVLSNPHSLQPSRTMVGDSEGGGTIVETVEGEEEVPHARGPELIGIEDTGPQRQSGTGLDIEGAVGRPSLGRMGKSPGLVENPGAKDEEMKEESEEVKEESEKDQDKMKTDE